MAELNEIEIINGIKNDNPEMIRKIYKMYQSRVSSLVYQFKNIQLDGDDVFQEGLVRAIMNIKEGKFQGKSSFYTYLYGICRNICLKEINKVKPTYSAENLDNPEQEEEIDFELIQRMLEVKEKLDHKCKEIIDLRFSLRNPENSHQTDSTRFENIASRLGISTSNARQRFKRCLEKLRQLTLNDPLFNELLN